MNAQVAADLRAAAEVLRRDGWCQFIEHGPSGGHCAVGALDVVIDPAWEEPVSWDLEQSQRFSRAYATLCAQVGTRIASRWNDDPGRTADEVIAALEAAADAAEASS